MPFKSKKQMARFFAKAKHSSKWREIADKWVAHTPNPKRLPKRKGKK